MIKKILEFSFIGILILIAIVIFVEVFTPEYSFFQSSLNNTPNISEEDLNIAYAENYTTLDPTNLERNTRRRTLNIYEPLITTDNNLSPIPSLALSWGKIDELTLQVELRKNVKFHNGKDLQSEDVIASIKRAKTHEKSQLKDILSTIESVEKKDENILVITTNIVDPLLVNKLTTVLIHPADQAELDIKPIGTGPYKFQEANKNSIKLTSFEEHWATAAVHTDVNLITIENKNQRSESLISGEIDFLVDFPSSEVQNIDKEKINFLTLPSLETQFILFDTEEGELQNPNIRKAIKMALDKDSMLRITNGFGKPINQLIPKGVFGFNPEQTSTEFNLAEAKKITKSISPILKIPFQLDISEDSTKFGTFLVEIFDDAGFDLQLNILSNQELTQRITEKETNSILIGWKNELGDGSNLLNQLISKNGKLSPFTNTSEEIQNLIDQLQTETDISKRITLIHEVTKLIEDNHLALPIFESETLFSYQKDISWTPRIDGFVLAKDITNEIN